MNESRETAQKILQELVVLFGKWLRRNPDEFNSKWRRHFVRARRTCPRKPGNLENLKTLLEVKRQPEMDDYYEHLMGMHREQEDFSLVGMLVDSAEITCPRFIKYSHFP
ncbi:hypothetical protein AB6818_01560 [Carnobacterium maltaromaticum]|uniref:hypothetical protein n=1 Tax=Carnobacterium maltaromaticum TaxID=2751 RepID=UPI0039BEA280